MWKRKQNKKKSSPGDWPLLHIFPEFQHVYLTVLNSFVSTHTYSFKKGDNSIVAIQLFHSPTQKNQFALTVHCLHHPKENWCQDRWLKSCGCNMLLKTMIISRIIYGMLWMSAILCWMSVMMKIEPQERETLSTGKCFTQLPIQCC